MHPEQVPKELSLVTVGFTRIDITTDASHTGAMKVGLPRAAVAQNRAAVPGTGQLRDAKLRYDKPNLASPTCTTQVS